MARHSLCALCNVRLFIRSLRHARSISHTPPHAFWGRQENADANVHTVQRTIADGPGTADGPRLRGRYSGKELRPEELLHQLDNPMQPDQSIERSRSFAKSPRSASKHDAKLIRPWLANKAELLVRNVEAEDFVQAWSALRSLVSDSAALSNGQSLRVFQHDGFMPALQTMLRHCTMAWLNTLQVDVKPATPPPLEVLKTLQVLQIRKPAVFRPLLWHAASGIAERWFSQKNNIGISQATKDLTQMWRICMSAQLTFQSADAFMTTDATDWSFLPPLTVIASWQPERRTASMFSDMLQMLVPVTKPALTPERIDYASAALVTLDLLRSVREKSAGIGLPLRESPECVPFVNLLETILRTAPRPTVPVQLRSKLRSASNPAITESYRVMAVRLDLSDLPPRPTAPAASGDAMRSAGFPLQDNETPAPVSTADGDSEDLVSSAGSVDFPGPDSAGPVESEVDRYARTQITRLARAIERQDVYFAEKIRERIFAYAGSRGKDAPALPLYLYEHLMRTFLKLRNPKAAVEIWKYIVHTGYTPTQKTYTIMLQGAQASKNLAGMEAVWEMMRKAGIKPDVFAWSIRIFGLMRYVSTSRGLDALNEMGREWLAAVKTEVASKSSTAKRGSSTSNLDVPADFLSRFPDAVNGVARPDIVVVNSAISALAAKEDQSIPKVLTWARTFDIKPDIVTYNVLLNVSMRKSRTDEALDILRRMQEQGIPADSSTWTVLLAALFEGASLDSLDHAQQQAQVIQFIDAFDENGLEQSGIDVKGYGLIIGGLLKKYGNQTAAAAVLAHMVARGKEPSAHIYTILMTSYFERPGSPDFTAVETLWRQMKSAQNGFGAVVDSVFYDCMIEGYARHHHTTGIRPALTFLQHARHAGQKPAWRALEMVCRALAERGDVNRLRALVDDVRNRLNESRVTKQKVGQRSFWNFILETGILKNEGITRPEQLLSADRRLANPILQMAA